jgi:hypothetical protein
MFVFSKNQKGRSQGVFIAEYHLGNYKKQQSDLIKQESHPSPILVGLFFTLLLLGMTIIARLYWKSRKIKKEVVREDKYNMESRCSLLKQDTFAVSQTTRTLEIKHDNFFIFYYLLLYLSLSLKMDAFSSPKFKPAGTSIKTRGKIETIDDEQDPDLIPHYPRLTSIHQEELIPMNSDPSFVNRERHKNNPANDFLTDVEINFQLSIMNGGKVPESCV